MKDKNELKIYHHPNYEQAKEYSGNLPIIDVIKQLNLLSGDIVETGNGQGYYAEDRSLTFWSNRYKQHGKNTQGFSKISGNTIQLYREQRGCSMAQAVYDLSPQFFTDLSLDGFESKKVGYKLTAAAQQAVKTPEQIEAERVVEFKAMIEKEQAMWVDTNLGKSRVIKYLCDERKLDREIIEWLLNVGYLTISEKKHNEYTFHNAMFVWKDINTGEIVGAEKHGLLKNKDTGERFKGIIRHSDKHRGFTINKSNGVPKKVVYFEATIDLISYLTLKKGDPKLMDTLFVSMNGMNDITVNYYKDMFPEAAHILAVDNDQAGEEFAAKFTDLYRIRPIASTKDWNDMLLQK